MANFKSIKAWQKSDGFDTQATQPDGFSGKNLRQNQRLSTLGTTRNFEYRLYCESLRANGMGIPVQSGLYNSIHGTAVKHGQPTKPAAGSLAGNAGGRRGATANRWPLGGGFGT